jgi:hypothetical protein
MICSTLIRISDLDFFLPILDPGVKKDPPATLFLYFLVCVCYSGIGRYVASLNYFF